MAYRIKHKPTGLYFCPSRGRGNLSKKGKAYINKPSLQWIGEMIKLDVWKNARIFETIKSHFGESVVKKFDGEDAYINCHVVVPETDWEIEEI